MRMHRILICTGIFPPDIGGPATYAETMADALIKRGFEVRVITYGGSKSAKVKAQKEKQQFKSEKFKVVGVSSRWPKGLRHLLYFCRLFFLIRKYDVVLALNAVSVGWPASIWAKIFKKRFVVRIVGDYAWEMAVLKSKTSLLIDDFQKSQKRGLLHSIQIKTCKRADMIIVPSLYLKNMVVGWGINENKIKIIYNAVDFQKPDLSKEEARKEIGIHGNIIISIGRLVPWKGFRMLIKIMPELLKINQFFRLVIVGDGPERMRLESIVKNMSLTNKVYISGKKSKQELTKYLAASDMFILNSGYEGFSHQVLEAMSAGVPVIASAVGGNKEIIRQGENGLLVKYNDEYNLIEAIKAISQVEEAQNQFIEEGIKTVNKYTVDKMLEETVRILSGQ